MRENSIIKKTMSNYVNGTGELGTYILDIGTGSANMAMALADMGFRCITIEKNSKAIEEARKQINNCQRGKKPLLIQMDACKIEFPDNTFDYVIAYRSMHHIKAAPSAMNEMFRVCKKSGMVIVIEHKKDIGNAIRLVTRSKEHEHPEYVGLDDIYKELKKKCGELSVEETDIGQMFILKKDGDSSDVHLEGDSAKIDLGCIDDVQYFFNSYTGEISSLKDNKEEMLISVEEKQTFPPASSLCLNLANKCNLNCKYCYAEGGNYGKSETLMDSNVAVDGIEWYQKHIGKVPHIIFFGGEPLINKQAIVRILEKYQKQMSYSINTNAILLDDEIVELLDQNNVKIAISIDGTKKTHDSQRIFKDGMPTYDLIVDKIKHESADVINKVWARLTITNQSISLYDDIMALLDLGFTKIDASFVAGNIEFSENEEIVERWKADIDKLASLALNKWLYDGIIIYPFVKVYQAVLNGKYACETCAAGREMLSLQADKSLVPCFKFSDVYLGSIETELDELKVKEFESYKENIRQLLCDGCWAYKFCGGLCPKDFSSVVKIQKHRCMIIQYLVKCSLLNLAKTFDKNRDLFYARSLQERMTEWLRYLKDK